MPHPRQRWKEERERRLEREKRGVKMEIRKEERYMQVDKVET